MTRQARIVVPGLPHHVTQRGSRSQNIFFSAADNRAYLRDLAACGRHYGLALWAYCLMPNHVHLIVVPATVEAMGRCLGETHRRHSQRINGRMGWNGHLWQDRFASFVMDQGHLLAAVRCVELNPLRAGLVERPEAFPWSSAAHHLLGRPDRALTPSPLAELAGDWQQYLEAGMSEAECERLRRHAKEGWPLGNEGFVRALENRLGRRLRTGRSGRPRVLPKSDGAGPRYFLYQNVSGR